MTMISNDQEKYISTLKPNRKFPYDEQTTKTQQDEQNEHQSIFLPSLNSSLSNKNTGTKRLPKNCSIPEKLALNEYIHSIENIKRD